MARSAILPIGAVTVACPLVRHTGGWTFAMLPPEAGLPPAGNWGMVPVIARLGGRTWATSVWRQKDGDYLPVPAAVRGGHVAGQTVEIDIAIDPARG